MTGRVESIHIIRGIDMPVERLDAVRVHAGRGLEGDRHTPPEGGSHEPGEFALTLVEAEALQAVRDEHGIDLSDGRSRRQVMTRGIRLNDLVGREFRVGTIRCRAVELCEPCTRAPRRDHGGRARGRHDLARRRGRRSHGRLISEQRVQPKGEPGR
jgi:MOSC domain-containing protein YiiM